MNINRLMIALANNHNWDLHQMDVKSSFFNVELKERSVPCSTKRFCKVGIQTSCMKVKEITIWS